MQRNSRGTYSERGGDVLLLIKVLPFGVRRTQSKRRRGGHTEGMRRLFGALIALLLAAPAPAQVRAVAEMAAPVSAGVSAAAATLSPLSYKVQLDRGEASAAGKFLQDVPTLSWYAENRPADLAPMLMAAHQALDVRAAAAYASDPVLLRRALLARADTPVFAAPSHVMIAVGSDPSLAKAAPAFAEAMLEWGALKDGQRAALARDDMDAARWSSRPLSERLAALSALYDAAWKKRSAGLAPGSPEYRALLNQYLVVAGPYLSQREEAVLIEHRERVKKVQARLDQARALLSKRGSDPDTLDRLASSPHLDDLESGLEAFFDRNTAATPGSAAPSAGPAATPMPLERFLASAAGLMPGIMKRITEGTEAGAMLEALDAGPTKTKVVIGKSAAGSSAHYAQIADEIVLNESHLSAFMRWESLTREQFLSDVAAQDRFALLIAPIYVHEATHRRQALASDRKGISRRQRSHLYSQSDEEESFMAQALIARHLLDQPGVEDWLRDAAVANREMNVLVNHWAIAKSSPKGIAAHVRRHYEGTAGEHTARARAIAFALADQRRLAPYRAAFAKELARRRRAPAVEREAFARLPVPAGGAPLTRYPTASLRDLARRASPTSHAGLIKFYGYLDGLKHAHAVLAASLTAGGQ
jgi:hypothetical protein